MITSWINSIDQLEQGNEFQSQTDFVPLGDADEDEGDVDDADDGQQQLLQDFDYLDDFDENEMTMCRLNWIVAKL